MVSVMIAPVIRLPSSTPRNVITGISELRSTCAPMTRFRERPLDVAVRT